MMAGRIVLDSFALAVYFDGSTEGAKIAELLKKARDRDRPALVSTVSLADVLRVVRLGHDDGGVQSAQDTLNTLPIEIVDFNREQAVVAGDISAMTKLPFNVCAAAALAKCRRATLVSADPRVKRLDGFTDFELL